MSKHSASLPRLTSEQLASVFVENNSDAVITLDPGGTIVGWNPGAKRLYGYSKGEVLRRPVTALFPSELPGEHLMRTGKLASARSFVDWETLQLAKDGTEIPLCISMSPLFDKAGNLTGRCMIARERLRASGTHSQVRQVLKLEAVGRLAGGIAHDFNNLLTVIAGYNSLLRSYLPADSPLVGYVAEVEKAADRAASLTSQLLVFSRRALTIPEVLSLNLVSQDLERMLERIIGKNIHIKLDLSPDLENIKADPGQISQMLMNLAVNARDAMPDGGTLRIATSNVRPDAPDGERPHSWPVGPSVQIEISDTGIGMDEHTREHIFEPFFTTKPKGKGTGLGLSIVYGIVSQMGGHIGVASEPGKGTCFTLSFPVTFETETEPGLRSMEAHSETRKPATGSTILLVEDEDGVRLLVKEMLLKLGHLVYDASSAEEALQLSGAREYDLLLTDVVMPTMSGTELALQLQESRPSLRVLYMSGYVEDSMLPDNFLKVGVNFLLKPFTADQLAHQVTRILEASQVSTVGADRSS